MPLDGGITNRNYRVRFGERDCVLRLPGRDTELLGIDRDAERVATERAAALGIAPPLIAADDECMVTEWLAGRPDRRRPPARRPVQRGAGAARLSRLRRCSCRSASGSPICSTTTRAIVARAWR